MPSDLPSFILAFHGCDRAVAEAVFTEGQHLKSSSNKYDWLGEGIYFWENSPTRALEYATLIKERPRKSGPWIKEPAVVGAVIDAGNCLNLLDAKFIQIVRDGYTTLVAASKASGVRLPKNKLAGPHRELLLRDLDCAVINMVHRTRQEQRLPAFDTVRAAFIEGQPLYPGSGFFDRNHIHLCVRNYSCIRGYFRPLTNLADGLVR